MKQLKKKLECAKVLCSIEIIYFFFYFFFDKSGRSLFENSKFQYGDFDKCTSNCQLKNN